MPEPVAIYPLNRTFETNDERRRPEFSGTARNVRLTCGPNNETDGAYEFYGKSSSYIEFPNDDGILDVKYSITLMCWVRPGEQGGPLFIYKGSGQWGVRISIKHGKFNNLIAFRFQSAQGITKAQNIETNQKLQEGMWVHVAATYDRETGDNCIYVDGERRQTQNIGQNKRIATNLRHIRMGVISNFFFNGAITQMRVYNVSLSAEQILAVRNQGRT